MHDLRDEFALHAKIDKEEEIREEENGKKKKGRSHTEVK